MRKQIFSAVLSTFFGLGVLAAAPQTQDQSNAEQHKESAHKREADPQRQVNMLSKKLNLTEDQKNQILPIVTDRHNR
jgi:Spy/CpxP family protein refolding chaperone